ncbi:MAG: serine/threonine protein kinase [Deltaproteobacteria bacterium]|nr:serine/threonine protein kinase [Deltaproteobacteria bacterium]
MARTGWLSRRNKESTAGRPVVRFGRALASPIGVLITLPLLVVAVGLGILLVGRDATRSASQSMAQRQLQEQALSVQADVAFALDQAAPMLSRVATFADPARPLDDVLVRLHDLMVGRAGVSYVSISFPDGTFRGAYLGEDRRVEVQESRVSASATAVRRFTVVGGGLVPLRDEQTTYDPRTRGFYKLATAAGVRVWTEPYPFFQSHETGITCAEPVYDGSQLRAVLTVDFDVGALSKFVARPALDDARSVMFTRSGVILAYPDGDKLSLPATEKLLSYRDLGDPAIDALLAQPAATALRFVELSAPAGDFLASVAPIGGQRAGVAVPLDWYVGTIVPVRTILGPTRRLERSSVIASLGALAIAVGLALVLAWNLVRMRKQVAAARTEARTAEARARELGSYKLVARLGAGGMGEVWRAEHRLLARSAAIKLIRAEALHDPETVGEIRERFRREAQTLASMKSRNTIAIYDYGVTEAGVFYYVMELLDGLDLESLVVRFGAPSAPRVIHILIQACSSLAEAHDAGLLHRDIKPPNLLLSRAADEVDIVKLLDFGIVQTVNDTLDASHTAPAISIPSEPALAMTETPRLTQVGAMLGTPGFMAPEQILGLPLDGRADLYALGCVAWWLLTGREIFKREGAEAKMHHKHLHDPVPSLRDFVRGWCPPELEDVLNACLAKEADQRPRDARELAARLRAIPIPAEHAWTEARARAWWQDFQPAIPAQAVSASEVQVIMPGHSEQRPHAAAMAETVVPVSHRR